MKLMVLDGNSIVNRAYYGVGYLSARSGQTTGAIYGFLNIMESLQAEEQPDALAVAFDLKAPTFRHKAYDGYKANRSPMPEELASQMSILKQVLSAMKIPMYAAEGWEADDILGTFGRISAEKGWECVIVTGDKDALQLSGEHVTVKLITTRQHNTTSVNYTPERFREEYGFGPRGLIDLKALMGDSSDNYPGVPGIGEKTAKSLMQEFGSLEAIYENLDSPSIKPAARKKLAEGRASADLCRDLAEIRTNAPVEFTPEDALLQPIDKPALLALFRQLDFIRLIDRYHLLTEDPAAPAQEEKPACEIVPITCMEEAEGMLALMEDCECVFLAWSGDLEAVALCLGDRVYAASKAEMGLFEWPNLLACVFTPEVKKVTHDCKSLMRHLLDQGLPIGGFLYDTQLAAYLLNPTASGYPLPTLMEQYCRAKAPEGLGGEAWSVMRLHAVLPDLVEEAGMTRVYEEIDFPLCPVLAEMEHNGIVLDRDALSAFGQMLSERIADCESIIYGYAGESFNINSTKQLGTLLFETLGLPHGKKTKSGYSTNIDVLEGLKDAHPIIPAIIDYRMLTKLRSTYAEGLIKCVASDGRIHTTFQNTVTATGRLSSTDPNLQNIPIRTELGGEIRRMFIPREGWVLVDADYSQIELRVLAHVAGDAAMQEAFRSGEDFHTITASRVFNVPPEDVTPLMRRSAKAVNFGIVYGISEFSLAGDLGITRWEAKEYMEGYFRNYPGVKKYMEQVKEDARACGYVSTLYGRRRALPELSSSNFNIRSGAERMALNTPIQGTAADIMKIAMLRVRRRLEQEGMQALIVLQVHDELIIECPREEAENVAALMGEEMEAAASLNVPLIAEAHIGESWYDAK